MRGIRVERLEALPVSEQPVEVVERKGIGHPDTICDALAETLSRNLCNEYLRRFGDILHHNVDKALLAAGRSEPELELQYSAALNSTAPQPAGRLQSGGLTPARGAVLWPKCCD